jgi:hypothetical protein
MLDISIQVPQTSQLASLSTLSKETLVLVDKLIVEGEKSEVSSEQIGSESLANTTLSQACL